MSGPDPRQSIKRLEALVQLALAARFQGPPSPPGSEIVAQFPFTYLTASPVNLGPVVGTINRAVLLIETPFDDPSATVAFGTSSFPNGLLSPSDSRVSVADQYESDALFLTTADFLRLGISPGASTRGAGLVFWKVLP